MFYPASGAALKATVQRYLEPPPTAPVPKAIIVPHAGYVYSGPVAGKAYSRISSGALSIRRVTVVGPSHRVPFRGLGVTRASAFATPLGEIPVDQTTVDTLLSIPPVSVMEAAHADEHSIEVQLPFLQVILSSFSLVPIVTGAATPEETARVLDAVWNGADTLLVISTDLSHYLPYEQARATDEATAAAIERLEYGDVEDYDACGAVGLRGLLLCAKRRGLRVERIDLRNSGDTAGPRDRVVGYGAFAVVE